MQKQMPNIIKCNPFNANDRNKNKKKKEAKQTKNLTEFEDMAEICSLSCAHGYVPYKARS